jgi:hypothetical protein
MRLPKITKKDVVYALIIANLIIWSISYVKTRDFYNDYVNLLINSAHADITETRAVMRHGDAAAPLSVEDWVLNEIRKAGLNDKEAWAIINCESRWRTDAVGVNTNGSYDLGIWQINSIHKNITNADKMDYQKATEWAINKRLNDGNWSAWVCSRKLNIN